MKPVSGGFALWITGLPCSGKTTLAQAVHQRLTALGVGGYFFDGDVLRKNLSSDLGFTKPERETHIRRVVAMAAPLVAHSPVIFSLISPYRHMRAYARENLAPFFEVYLRCPVATCEKRDVKGMYRLARAGKLENFTGVSAEYEEPHSPEITLDTEWQNLETCAATVMTYLEKRRVLFR